MMDGVSSRMLRLCSAVVEVMVRGAGASQVLKDLLSTPEWLLLLLRTRDALVSPPTLAC